MANLTAHGKSRPDSPLRGGLDTSCFRELRTNELPEYRSETPATGSALERAFPKDRSQGRSKEPVEDIRKKISASDTQEIDELLLKTLTEGLSKHSSSFSALSFKRNQLIKAASTTGVAHAINHVIEKMRFGLQTSAESFATRSLRQLFCALPSAWDGRIAPISCEAAIRLLEDLLEKSGHADFEHTMVAPYGRAIRMAVKAIRVSQPSSGDILTTLAARAHSILTEEKKYSIPKKAAEPLASFGLGFYGMDFGDFERRPAARKTTSKPSESKAVSLVEKLADDDHNLLMAARSRTPYREPDQQEKYDAWKKWASRRQAHASICMLVMGEAGAASNAATQQAYIAILEPHIKFKNKTLAGCAVASLGSLVNNLPLETQASWLHKVQAEIPDFRVKASWKTIEENLDLGLRIGAAPQSAVLNRLLTDKHPKVRKAAFRQLQNILDSALSDGERFSIIEGAGLLARHPFGMDARIQYPFEAAGRMAQFLEQEISRCKTDSLKTNLEYTWASIQTTSSLTRQRVSANLPPFEQALELITLRAQAWPTKLVSQCFSHMVKLLPSQRPLEDLDPKYKVAICCAALKLAPKLSDKDNNRLAEILVLEGLSFEGLLLCFEQPEREAVLAKIGEKYGKFNTSANALRLRDYSKRSNKQVLRDLFSFTQNKKNEPDPLKDALIAACTIADLKFLISEAVSPQPATNSRSESVDSDSDESDNEEFSPLSIDGGMKRDRAASAAEVLLEKHQELLNEEIESLIPPLVELINREDGRTAQYGEPLSDQRRYALRLCIALAQRVCITHTNSPALQILKDLASNQSKDISAKTLEYLVVIMTKLPETLWNELGAAARTGAAAQHRSGYYLEYALNIAATAKEPRVRALHLDMLLDFVRGNPPSEQLPYKLTALLKALPQAEAQQFLDLLQSTIRSHCPEARAYRSILGLELSDVLKPDRY